MLYDSCKKCVNLTDEQFDLIVNGGALWSCASCKSKKKEKSNTIVPGLHTSVSGIVSKLTAIASGSPGQSYASSICKPVDDPTLDVNALKLAHVLFQESINQLTTTIDKFSAKITQF